MLEFKDLELRDIPLISPFFNNQPSIVSGRTIGGLFMWRKHCRMSYAVSDGVLYLKGKFSTFEAFFPPCCKDVSTLNKAFENINDYCKSKGIKPMFCNLEEKELPIYTDFYKNLEISFNDTWSDYVYNLVDLQNFSGKKYHGQKNFLNRFKRLYPNFYTEKITSENLEKVKDFIEEYYKNTKKDAKLFDEEKESVFEVLNNYDLYGMLGLMLMVDGKIVALAMGEKLGNMVFVHIEKANTQYLGAYQTMVNEFAKFCADGNILYENREDDAGDEGLRISKKSYHPVFMVKKYKIKVLD